MLNLRNDGTARIYQTQPVLIKKKKVLFAQKTAYKDDEEDDRKFKESKHSIKIIKKNLDKTELLLKKRTLQEYHLENVKNLS